MILTKNDSNLSELVFSKEVHKVPKLEKPKREIRYTITLESSLQVDKRACNVFYDLDDLNSPLSLLVIV